MYIKRAIGLTGFYLLGNRLKDRFVAGSTLREAVAKAKFFRDRGEKSVINILGEHVKEPDTAIRFRKQIIELMVLLNKEGLTDVNIAEKPSQLGLDITRDLYWHNKRQILKAAQIYLPDGLVETDAEDRPYRERVFKITLELSKYFSNQLLACQLNQPGVIQEIQTLNEAGIPVRICKGAYEGGIKGEDDLRRIFLTAVPVAIAFGKRPAFATHDLFLIDYIAKQYAEYKERFEFNLLMGIEANLCQEKHLQGLAFRRYIPCDPNNNWRPYAKRRAETILNIWARNFLYRMRK